MISAKEAKDNVIFFNEEKTSVLNIAVKKSLEYISNEILKSSQIGDSRIKVSLDEFIFEIIKNKLKEDDVKKSRKDFQREINEVYLIVKKELEEKGFEVYKTENDLVFDYKNNLFDNVSYITIDW